MMNIRGEYSAQSRKKEISRIPMYHVMFRSIREVGLLENMEDWLTINKIEDVNYFVRHVKTVHQKYESIAELLRESRDYEGNI